MNSMNLDLSLPLLVVDDNQQMRSVIKSILADIGYAHVYLAGSGEEACRILKERPIAGVISDLDMPGMNGLQLLSWVRDNVADAALPFMLLPAEANRDELRAASAAGVTDCLIKPFTLATFHSKLRALFGARRAAPAATAHPATVSAAASASAPAIAMTMQAASRLIGMERPLEDRLREATVLVVDDIATNIKVIAGMLAEEGYGVKVAVSGRKALEIVPVHRPDIILLDVMMPEMDGFEVCRRLKADPATADIPVIFLSAKDQAEDIVGGLELGAVDYVTKPVDPAILKARMRTHLRMAAMMGDLRRQNSAVVDNAHLREEVERLTRYDLATPLAEVIAASELLLADPAPGMRTPQREALQALEALNQAARRALCLASLSLELCRIEQGACRPNSEPVALNGLLMRPAADIMASHPMILPAPAIAVRADRVLCHMLLEHLILNAAAQTPDGGAITMDAVQRDGHWLLTLEHAGTLPATQQACLRDETPQRPDDEEALPLYAARLLAEVQGGTLRLEDAGRAGSLAGTRLVLQLPAA